MAAMMPAAVLPDEINSSTFSVTGGNAVERLRAGQMVPWQGFIVVEGVETGDGRFVNEGALSWQNELLPVPLMAQFENPVGGSGHDGAVLAGKIMTMTRIGSKVWATGYIDPFTPGGIRLALALDRQTMRGISVDLDSVELADSRNGVRNISKGRIRGATVCPFQAIVEATIELTTEEGDAMAASAGQMTARVFTVSDPVDSLVASGGSSIPLAPPKAWFALPSDPNDINHPLEITADGRLSGIIAAEGTCHIAFGNKCEPPPKSKTKYAAFRVGSVHTAEGDSVRTGPIVMDTVHPDLRRSASDAMAFYAHTGAAVADVVPYDTQFGIYIAGVMRPDATPQQIRNLRASDISPDWRFINGNPRECCALLAVNNGGFKVPQSLAASAGDYIMPGQTAVAVTKDQDIMALVASGGVRQALADCGCDEIPTTDRFSTTNEIELNCGKPEHEDDDYVVEEEDKEELSLADSFLAKFGPRRFHTPKVRVFRVEQFHGNHDQSTHGNRAGASSSGGDGDGAKPDPYKGGKLSTGERVAPLGKATGKRHYDKAKRQHVDGQGIPIIHWKTGKPEPDSWNLIRDDQSDLTDDNVYGPGKSYAPAPPSEPYWLLTDSKGYAVRGAGPSGRGRPTPPAELKDWDPRQPRRQ